VAGSLDHFQGPDGGWAILTLSTSDCGGEMDVRFERVVGRGSGEFFGGTGKIHIFAKADDIADPNYRAMVMVHRLPAGRYRLSYLEVANGACSGGQRQYSRLNVPFEIKEGRGLYLGDVHFTEHYGMLWKVLTEFAGWTSTVVDHSDRDLPIARAKAAGLTDIDVSLIDQAALWPDR
jgi:hypothetical protein